MKLARPGDVILVRAGSHASFGLERGITVAADAGAVVTIHGTVGVSGLPAGETAVLRGLNVGTSELFPALTIAGRQGATLVEDCEFLSAGAYSSVVPGAIVGVEVFIADSSVKGGFSNGGCTTSLWLVAGNPDVRLLATTVGPVTASCPWPAIVVDSGFVSTVTGAPRVFQVTSPLREGVTASVTLTGDPGYLALFGISPNAHADWVPAASGVCCLLEPFALRTLGVLPAAGKITGSFVVPPLPPAGLGRTLFFQGAETIAGVPFLGTPSAVTFLDASL